MESRELPVLSLSYLLVVGGAIGQLYPLPYGNRAAPSYRAKRTTPFPWWRAAAGAIQLEGMSVPYPETAFSHRLFPFLLDPQGSGWGSVRLGISRSKRETARLERAA